MSAKLVLVEAGVVGKVVVEEATALCDGPWIRAGDRTDLDLLVADRGVGAFVVRVIDFPKPRPGGFVGVPSREFVLTAESTVRWAGLTEDTGALGIGDLTGGTF